MVEVLEPLEVTESILGKQRPQFISYLTNLTVTPPALTYMSGMMSTPMSWRILSAAGVIGPFAASAIILALIFEAFPKTPNL